MGGGDLREASLDIEQVVHECSLEGLLGQTDSGVFALVGDLLGADNGVHAGSSVLVIRGLGAARRRLVPGGRQ
jgi:hypothetical protein